MDRTNLLPCADPQLIILSYFTRGHLDTAVLDTVKPPKKVLVK